MKRKFKFSSKDEERIINFVKKHGMLYNVKHAHFRDKEGKERLWRALANQLNCRVDAVMKKWRAMRDYFLRKRLNSSSLPTSKISKREEMMLFLVQTSPTKSEIAIETPSISLGDEIFYMTDDAINKVSEDVDNQSLIYESECPVSECAKSERAESECAEFNESNCSNFIEAKPKSQISLPNYKNQPMNFNQHTATDDIQLFFDSMAATVRKFPLTEIAQIKMKIANLVGEEEIRWIQQQATEAICSEEDEDNVDTASCEREMEEAETPKVKRIRKRPSMKGQFVCDQCGKTFNDSSNLREHLVRHTGIKKFPCRICSKKFYTAALQRRHERWHKDGNPHQCHYCSKRFVNTNGRLAHERNHHLNYKPFKCTQCDKAFAIQSMLKDHMLSHTQVRKYPCDICSMSFLSSSNLANHLRTKSHKDKAPPARNPLEELLLS